MAELCGCQELNVVDSIYGHDGFLVETTRSANSFGELWSWQHGDSDESRQRRRSLSFGEEARAYERGRPSYTAGGHRLAAVVRCANCSTLGAGTGKLTIPPRRTPGCT